MEWKNKIDENCISELEEMMIDNIKAGFLSNSEILEECKEYVEDNCLDDSQNITDKELLQIIELYRDKFSNHGNQENFKKLDLAFNRLVKQGIIVLHYAGYTQDEGFSDCNEIASHRYEKGEKIIGCCFYSVQDLGHILHGDSTTLYLSFGNYFDKPTAIEIGQLIVKELEKTGWAVEWNQTAEMKIGIKNIKWDKYYIDSKKMIIF